MSNHDYTAINNQVQKANEFLSYDTDKIERKIFKNNWDELERVPKAAGVYYYYEDDRVLYVGLSKNLRYRLKQHEKNNSLIMKVETLTGLEEDEETTEDLRKYAIARLKQIEFFQRLGSIAAPINFDFVLHKSNRIEIEELPYHVAKMREIQMKEALKPPYNYESNHKAYYEIFE